MNVGRKFASNSLGDETHLSHIFVLELDPLGETPPGTKGTVVVLSADRPASEYLERAFERADGSITTALTAKKIGEDGLWRDSSGQAAQIRKRLIGERTDLLVKTPSAIPKNDSDPLLARRRVANLVRRLTNRGWFVEHEPPNEEPSAVQRLIASGESSIVEFKSTMRFDVALGRPNKKIEHAVFRAICSLLNSSRGGHLLIGVADDQTICGLDADYKVLKNDRDGFEAHLRALVRDNLSGVHVERIAVGFESIGGKDVCQVRVTPAPSPVFAKPAEGKGQVAKHFWIRSGNATNELVGEAMLTYQAERWSWSTAA